MPPENDKQDGLMDEVNKAIGVDAPEPEEDVPPNAETEGAQEEEPDKTPSSDDDGEPEKKPDDEGVEFDDDEQPPDKDDEGEEGEDKDDGEDDGEEGGDDAKPSDQFGELPQNAKGQTKERFGALKQGYDELHGQLETTKQQLEDVKSLNSQMVEIVQSTGADEQQFGMTLNYLRLRNSNDPEDLEIAYKALSAELSALAEKLGIATENFNPLDEYPDLKKSLADGDITEKYALEIAKDRRQQALSRQSSEKRRQATTEQEERQNALRDLAALGDELSKDPHFEYKRDMLASYTELVLTTEKDPGKWAEKIKSHFEKIPNPPTNGAGKQPEKKSGKNPVRPGAGSGGGDRRKEPGSAYEAVDMALDSM